MATTGCDAVCATAAVRVNQILSGAAMTHHKDPAIMMFPYFTVPPDQLEQWKQNAERFYEAASQCDDLMFCGMAYSGNRVHIRQGYRSADAFVAHLQRIQVFMSETLRTSTLDKVEVHGSLADLVKVKRHITMIGPCAIQFFEAHRKMQSVRRPTAYSGHYGSDRFVTCHASITVASAAELRAMEPKIKCIHRHACGCPGNESFLFSRALEHGTGKLVITCDSMEATVEHLATMVAHLGMEAISHLEVHGPAAEMGKLNILAQPGRPQAAPHASPSYVVPTYPTSLQPQQPLQPVVTLASPTTPQEKFKHDIWLATSGPYYTIPAQPTSPRQKMKPDLQPGPPGTSPSYATPAQPTSPRQHFYSDIWSSTPSTGSPHSTALAQPASPQQQQLQSDPRVAVALSSHYHPSGPTATLLVPDSLAQEGAPAGMYDEALAAATQKAAEDARQAKASADAAEMASSKKLPDAIKQAREETVATLRTLQNRAKGMAHEIYRLAASAAGGTADAAADLAKTAYRRRPTMPAGRPSRQRSLLGRGSTARWQRSIRPPMRLPRQCTTT